KPQYYRSNYLIRLLASLAQQPSMQLKQEILERQDWSACPLCKGKIVLDIESGENICDSCGLVVGNEAAIVGSSAGDITKQNSNSLSSTANLPLGQTFIDRRNVDSRGKKIRAADNLFMIRRLDNQASIENSDRSIKRAVVEIRRIAERLGIGSAAEREAMSIYYKASKNGLIRGRSVDGICTAAIYVACRKLNIPRLLQDIIEVAAHEDRKQIAPYFKLLIRELGIHLPQLDAAEYVDYIARNARISPKTQREALTLLSEAGSSPKLSGKRPISVAAAALYLASRKTGENTSQLRIAGATNLTPTTVRKTSMDIEQILAEKRNSEQPIPLAVIE
ncbi:MAG: transcription initiation factor IIB family protein, partial [Nitrososphaerales archaeon]